MVVKLLQTLLVTANIYADLQSVHVMYTEIAARSLQILYSLLQLNCHLKDIINSANDRQCRQFGKRVEWETTGKRKSGVGKVMAEIYLQTSHDGDMKYATQILKEVGDCQKISEVDVSVRRNM